MEDSLLDCLFEVDEQLLFDGSLSSLEGDEDNLGTSQNGNEGESFGETRELPMFNCYQRRSTTELSASSFIKTGVLERLLSNNSPYPGAFEESVTPLCGYMTVTCQVLFDDLDTTFLRFRRQFNTLLNQMSNPTVIDKTNSSSLKDCVTFLHFIDYQIAKLTRIAAKDEPHPLVINIINNIITHMNNTITSIQPLDQFFSSMDMFPSGFHLILHLLWCTVSVLYRTVLYMSSSLDGVGSHLTAIIQFCNQIIELFLKESSLHFDQHKTCTIFHCPCIKEVWLLIVIVTDKLSADFNTQSFWNLISRIVSMNPSLSYAWWATVQVTNLYQYDIRGFEVNISDKEKCVKGDWSIVEDLIAKTIKFQNDNKSESDLRWCLNCLFYLYNTWTVPSLTTVVLLWGYYHKHFNNSFQLSGLGVNSFLSIDTLSCVDWFKHSSTVLCRRSRYHRSFNGRLDDGRNSFEIFLQILYTCLKDDLHGNQMWRQMKSRLYSKFSQRKVCDLDLQGICHLITLYLTLIHVTESEEPGVQLFSLLSNQRLSSDSRSQLIWKGIMALLMTCIEMGVALPETVVTKIISNMTEIPLQSSVDSNTVSIVTIILQGMLQLVDMKMGVVSLWTLPLYVSPFITNVINCEVTFGKVNSFILDVLNLLSSELSTLCDPGHHCNMEATNDYNSVEKIKNFSKSFWNQICPPMVRVLDSPCLSSSCVLSETFGKMTQFACTWINFEEGYNVFKKVGLSDSTSPELAAAYLVLILNESSISNNFVQMEDSQYSVCHSWLRCLLILNTSHPVVIRLTASLMKLDSLKELISEHNTMSDINDPITLFLLVIKGVANKHSFVSNIDDKYIWKQRLAIILGQNYCTYYESTGSNLRLYYRMSSAVVRHCAGLIYSKSSARCLLPQILDTLVLPVTSRKPLPTGMTLLIKNNLHHFLFGLFTLEVDKDEFVSRKIRQIFSRYFRTYAEPASPLMGGVASHINPFITLLAPAFIDTPTRDSCYMLITCLKIIITQELTFPQRPQLMIPCLLFLNTLLPKLSSIDLLLQCVPLLLERMLSSLLMCTRSLSQPSSSNLHKETIKCLTILMTACNNHPDKLPISKMLPLVREYLVINIMDYKQDVFKPLVSMVTHCPSLSSRVVDLSHSVVMEYELKKGSGVDKGLRNAYEDFKSLLLKT